MKTPTCTSAITQNVDHRVVLVAIRIPSSCTRLPDVESVARARAPACDRPMSTDLCTAIGGTVRYIGVVTVYLSTYRSILSCTRCVILADCTNRPS